MVGLVDSGLIIVLGGSCLLYLLFGTMKVMMTMGGYAQHIFIARLPASVIKVACRVRLNSGSWGDSADVATAINLCNCVMPPFDRLAAEVRLASARVTERGHNLEPLSSMNYLVTLKPVSHNTNVSSYSVLLEVNWVAKSIVRVLRLPDANHSNGCGYMRSFIQGVSMHDGLVYVTGWNYVAIVDYSSFTVIDAFSHPLMADNHGIHVSDADIIICATAIDAVLCLGRKGQELKWWWRPDDSPLDSKWTVPQVCAPLKKTARLWGKVARRLGISRRIKVPFQASDYRGQDKKNSPYHNHHVNEVTVDDGMLYVLSKGWNDPMSSAIMKLDLETRDAEMAAVPGSFCGAHDLFFEQSRVLVTESGSASVGWLEGTGEIAHRQLYPKGIYIRGLDAGPDGYLVGVSYNRLTKQGPRSPVIREYDPCFEEVSDELSLEGFYPNVVGGAIHNIYAVNR